MTRKLLAKLIIFGAVLSGFVTPVLAGGNVTVNDGETIGLLPIRIPTFMSAIVREHFSIFSYVAFVVAFMFVIIAVYWVWLIIKAAYAIVLSDGDDKKIQEASKRFNTVFWSITTLFGAFIILSFFAALFGLGSFYQWPRSLSQCQDGSFYFIKALQIEATTEQDIYNACFGSGGTTTVPAGCSCSSDRTCAPGTEPRGVAGTVCNSFVLCCPIN